MNGIDFICPYLDVCDYIPVRMLYSLGDGRENCGEY